MKKIIKVFLVISFILCFVGFNILFAEANTTTSGDISLYSTFNSIGVISIYTGDENSNNSVKIEYRILGDIEWIEGNPPSKISDNRFAGSIFFLDSGTNYEVRLTYEDPDGVDMGYITDTIATRSENFTTGTGSTYHVGSGYDYATIQDAVGMTGPGDTVMVHEGIYRERVTINSSHSGTENDYILYKAADGENVVIDNSDETLTQTPDWQASAYQDVYVTTIDWVPGYVSKDEERLYHYQSITDLETLELVDTLTLEVVIPTGGWFFDENSQELYIKFSDLSDPNLSLIYVSKRDFGFLLYNASYVIIDGFEVRYTSGSGIRIVDGERNVIQNNLIHNTQGGIYLSDLTNDNLIQENEIYDTSISSWPWTAMKNTDHEKSGVSLWRSGSGNIVRDNIIHGIFNGIAPSSWGALADESYNSNIDVYRNKIYAISDDGLEPEGACINNRFWENTILDSYKPVSAAPITVGPVYFIRNIFYNNYGGSFTFMVDEDYKTGPVYAYHNTIFIERPDENVLGFFSSEGTAGVNFIARNNIFQATRYVIEDTAGMQDFNVDLDYDNLYTTDPTRFVKWRNIRYSTLIDFQNATNQELNGIVSESNLENPSLEDFNLAEGSQLINKGVILPGINDDFMGIAPDIGALEFFEQAPPRIFIIGDSTVADYPEGNCMQGWGYSIRDSFIGSVETFNNAVEGASSKTFIEDGHWISTLQSLESGDYILIQFGHNDSHDPELPESTDADTDYKMYLERYINESRLVGVEPILVTPPHRRTFIDGVISQELEPYAVAMKEVADDKGVIYIDLHDMSGELMQALGEEGCLYLFCSPDDRSHFSLGGSETMASLVINSILNKNAIPSEYIIDIINQSPNIESYQPLDLNPEVDEGVSLDFGVTVVDPDDDNLFYSWKLDGAEQSTGSDWIYLPDFTSSGDHVVEVDITDIFNQEINLVWNVLVNDISAGDTIPPTGSIIIDSDNEYTTSQ
ncbi:GDSL-type esterase/lipase family protein, partial [Patescibacteria group bacterium]